MSVHWFLAISVFTLLSISHGPAWAWKALAYHQSNSCIVDCGGPAYLPIGFPVVIFGGIMAMMIFYWMHRLHKYETISLTCNDCGRPTRGLKCPYH